MPIVFFCSSAGKYPHSWGACAFYALYILFSSFQFNSFLFYSIQRDEKNETLRMITKKTKNNENYEILRKKGNTLIKNHDSVIFYVKTVYFFIHAKNVFITFFLFFVRFSFFRSFFFFSFVFLFFVNFVLLVICSAGCRRIFSVFSLFFARFLLCCACACFCVFFVFMQNNFCIFCWIAPYSVSRLKFQLYFSESMLY